MKTKAVRPYGKRDLPSEEFELSEIGEGAILAKIASDSIYPPGLGITEPAFARLARIEEPNNGLWCMEAEKFLLERGL
ncbi:MAG: hypothetical protein FWH55_09035 [Oscillospiraceae bacterium]|nr:hypothetical protein [Oscillospiraceae bacterium]